MVRKKIRKWGIVLEGSESQGRRWGFLRNAPGAPRKLCSGGTQKPASTSRVGKVLLVQGIVGWGLDRKSSKIAVGKDVGVAEKGQGGRGPLQALNAR